MNYKERLKNLRIEHDLTQEELAEKINLTRGAYKQYELQYDIIPLVHLNTLANYFNTSIDFLFSFTDIAKYKNSLKEIDTIKFSSHIKELRKENKLTQAKFAYTIDTNQSIISDLEKNRKIVNTTLLYTICKKYNISADYLLGKIDSPKYLK